MSTRRSLGYAEDGGQTLHLYTDCMEDHKRVHIDLEGENGMEATLIVPAELFREVLRDMVETSEQIDKLKGGAP